MKINKEMLSQLSIADLSEMREYIRNNRETLDDQYGERAIGNCLDELNYCSKDKFKELFPLTPIDR